MASPANRSDESCSSVSHVVITIGSSDRDALSPLDQRRGGDRLANDTKRVAQRHGPAFAGHKPRVRDALGRGSPRRASDAARARREAPSAHEPDQRQPRIESVTIMRLPARSGRRGVTSSRPALGRPCGRARKSCVAATGGGGRSRRLDILLEHTCGRARETVTGHQERRIPRPRDGWRASAANSQRHRPSGAPVWPAMRQPRPVQADRADPARPTVHQATRPGLPRDSRDRSARRGRRAASRGTKPSDDVEYRKRARSR
jgi:hypothetical protein